IASFPAEFDDETRRVLTEKYLRAIDTQIVPAYRRLRAFVHDEYLPRCRTTVGIGDLPAGKAMYAFAVRGGTTTSLTPAEIFALGEREVTRISAEIDRLDAEMTAAGDAPLVLYASADDLLRGYAEFRAAVEAK